MTQEKSFVTTPQNKAVFDTSEGGTQQRLLALASQPRAGLDSAGFGAQSGSVR